MTTELTTPAWLPSPRRVFALVLAGLMTVQLAWILALPAFHGIDEFAHVYKADAVAHGQWWPPREEAGHDQGQILDVRRSLVASATALCESLVYTGPQNCRPISDAGGGLVRVASGAATYDPVWYAAMGTVALPFRGEAAVYAMRLFAALVSALLCAWAAALSCRWAKDRWPLAALFLAATPVVTYSASVAAPNGPEYAAALLTWSAALALARSTASRAPALPLAMGATLMCVAHSTGPFWLAVILLTTFLLAPWRHWTELVRRHPGTAVSTTLVVVGAALGSVGYVLLARTNTPLGLEETYTLDVPRVLLQDVLWPFQAVAAFPMREDPAPGPVYAMWLLPLLALLVVATRRSSARTRVAAGILLATTVLVPTLATIATYSRIGTAWQGRYSLPLYVGLPLIAGWSLTGRRPLPTLTARIGTALLSIAVAVSVGHVARDIVVRRPGVSAAELVPGGWLLVALLAGLGTLLLPLAWQQRGRALVRPALDGTDAVPRPDLAA